MTADYPVAFEVEGERFELAEREATQLGEQLRLRAAGVYGEVYGLDEALAVADEIEARLVDDRAGPVVLEADDAEAVFYALHTTVSNLVGEVHRLYLALRRLHGELERL